MVEYSEMFYPSEEEKGVSRGGDKVPGGLADLPLEPRKKDAPPGTGPAVPDAGEIYRKTLSAMNGLFDPSVELNQYRIFPVKSHVEEMVDSVQRGGQELLDHVFAAETGVQAEFFALNAVNTCILSLETGTAAGFDRDRLLDMGLAALFHDIGLREHRDLVLQKRVLDYGEKHEIRQGALSDSGIVARLSNTLGEGTVETIREEQRGLHVAGCPSKDRRRTTEDAQMICLADVYEALTHARPYRPRYPALETWKTIVSEFAFDPGEIKALLERIGMYPRGMFIELSTKEIARVVQRNDHMPLCPIVRVVYDASGRRVGGERLVDLAAGTRIFVKRSL